ncbi:MAG TPA: hypothetical protein VN695_19275, partial [Streptosporangiaceae bacterium]|nr:hypothetical protein [Streptosporangiaceae bacterium]
MGTGAVGLAEACELRCGDGEVDRAECDAADERGCGVPDPPEVARRLVTGTVGFAELELPAGLGTPAKPSSW